MSQDGLGWPSQVDAWKPRNNSRQSPDSEISIWSMSLPVSYRGSYQEELETLCTICIDSFLPGCLPGASQVVPGWLPGWNNSNKSFLRTSWDVPDPNQTMSAQCLDIVWRSSVKLPGRNNFVTMNVPGIPVPYQDEPKRNSTCERLGTFLTPACAQPITKLHLYNS